MKHAKHRKDKSTHIADELTQIDTEVGKFVAPAGEGIDLKPASGTDAFTKKLMEDERAFMNPEEWGIDLRPIVDKVLSPPLPDDLPDDEVRGYLRCLVDILARHHLCLTCTNHLSDRDLYRLILTRVLEEPVGIGPDAAGTIIYHECCPCDSDEYLAYYECEDRREELREEFDIDLPEKRPLVSDRDIWIELLAEAFRDQPLPKEE